MNILKTKATSPGVRHKIKIKKSQLSKNNLFVKNLFFKKSKKAGKSTQTGHTTTRHKGGGAKQRHRRVLVNTNTAVFINVTTFYNPNRNSFLSLKFNFLTCLFSLTETTENFCIGALSESGNNISLFVAGSFVAVKKIPTGSIIHGLTERNKRVYSRSAGTCSQIVQRGTSSVKIKLSSGCLKNFKSETYATIGSVANKNFNKIVIGKAGISRLNNKRPKVRGVAMNPVDHPHGGRTNGGRPSVSPWGKLTKGVKTKKNV